MAIAPSLSLFAGLHWRCLSQRSQSSCQRSSCLCNSTWLRLWREVVDGSSALASRSGSDTRRIDGSLRPTRSEEFCMTLRT